MGHRYFITATGTDIGKTYFSEAFIKNARLAGKSVAAFKPIMSGYDPIKADQSDAGRLLAALNWPLSAIERIAPWRFAAPITPSMAAEKENRTLDFDDLIAFSRQALIYAAELTLIEGVGGLMSPITQDKTVLDWIDAIRAPVILLSGSYLGAISHCLTAIEVLRLRALSIAAVVVSETPGSDVALSDTVVTLKRFLPGKLISPLPLGNDAGDICRQLIA